MPSDPPGLDADIKGLFGASSMDVMSDDGAPSVT